jgi:hypothetical protein
MRPPNPPREGSFADVTFNGHMSGLFGRELPVERWLQFDDAAGLFVQFTGLARRDASLAHGWLDLHAAKSAALFQS